MLKKKCNKAWWEYLKDLASKVHNKKEHTLYSTYFNSERKGCNDLRVLKLDQASILTNECGISERIKYFESVLTQENLENIPSFQQIIVNDNLNFLQCSLDFVTKFLKELKPHKSPGPDGIHPLILK